MKQEKDKMDKKKQVWFRYTNDREGLNVDCVDLLSKCYLMLGQKPDAEQIVLMSKFLVDDLAKGYGSLQMNEVSFAFEQGIRHSENGGFVNVRNWNIWLKEYKSKAQLKRQQNLVTDYDKFKQGEKLIRSTINKAKKLNG
jgi:hypothetical protein